MAHINDNYLKLKAGYLFPEIGRRVAAFAKENPAARIIRMGIGDVTEPLPAACVEAMHKAVDEQAKQVIDMSTMTEDERRRVGFRLYWG